MVNPTSALAAQGRVSVLIWWTEPSVLELREFSLYRSESIFQFWVVIRIFLPVLDQLLRCLDEGLHLVTSPEKVHALWIDQDGNLLLNLGTRGSFLTMEERDRLLTWYKKWAVPMNYQLFLRIKTIDRLISVVRKQRGDPGERAHLFFVLVSLQRNTTFLAN